MLERFSRALTSGDGKGAAGCWQVPALVVADRATLAISSAEEVAEFFGDAARQYNAKGIYGTRPEVQQFTPVSKQIASVLVRWPYLNTDGAETSAVETSMYIVKADENSEPKICVALMLGASE